MKFITGNLFDSNAEALVNTVNTVGVMGKGVALQFKERFPQNFDLYQKACKKGEVEVGKMFITPTNSLMNPKWIINFPTKKHWRYKSNYSYIEKGLEDFIKQIKELGIQSVAIPPLGAGQGGLDWEQVKNLIHEKLSPLPVDILVYEPLLAKWSQETSPKTNLSKPRAMVLSLVAQYKKLGYDISLLEIQKLAYFLQRMGQKDLKLHYKQYHYGPYAHNLQHLLYELEKGFIQSDRSVLDSKPFDLIFLNPSAAKEVSDYLEEVCTAEEKQRLDNVFSLMSGFETPFGLELLASVDWILNTDTSDGMDSTEIKAAIKAWSKRKDESFTLDHVRHAQVRLQAFSPELAYGRSVSKA